MQMPAVSVLAPAVPAVLMNPQEVSLPDELLPGPLPDELILQHSRPVNPPLTLE